MGQPENSANRRVVVTGIGIVSPLGGSAAETFANACEGRSGIRTIDRFDPSGLPCSVGGQVPDGEPCAGGIAEARPEGCLSRAARLMERAAAEACRQARLETVPQTDRTAVVIGAHGDNPSMETLLQMQRFHTPPNTWSMPDILGVSGFDPLQICRRKPDMTSAAIARIFGLHGPNLTVCSACAAGAQGIGEAFRLIREGCCESALAGGCEAVLDMVGFPGFVLLHAMAEKYTSPETASRPFDRKRSGFVMSEGAGALFLESLPHAQARGARILGEVLGYGDSADAYRITDVHPSGEGAVLAMRGAIADAGLTCDDIEYINAHGTSTQLNDATESRAIRTVFGERAAAIPVSSNKSMIGHTIAAAGAIESALTLMGLQRGILLPTINYEYPDPKCNLDYVPNRRREVAHRVALSNSFGFGGQNACLCLGRWDS